MKLTQRITAAVLSAVLLLGLSVFVRTTVRAADAITMTDATVIESNVISIGFSAAKIGNAGATAYVRIVDDTGAVVKSKTEGNSLQWNAGMDYFSWPNAPMKSKITNSVTVDGTAVNTAQGVLDLIEGEYSNYTAVFCLRESATSNSGKNVVATKNNGFIDSYFANNDGSNKYIAGTNPALKATTVDKDGWDEVRVTLAYPTPNPAVTEVVAMEENKLHINFSCDAIGNAGATVRVRLVDANGTVLKSQTENNTLEWSVEMNYVTWPKTPMTGKITSAVTVDGKTVNTVAGVRALLSSYSGAKCVLYIKEGTSANPDKCVTPVKGNGLIDSYYAINNGTNAYIKYVNPALTASGTASDSWDDLTVEILDPAPTLNMTEVAVSGDNAMTVSFDAAKVGSAGGSVYVRIVDQNGKLMTKDGVNLNWNAAISSANWPNTPYTGKITNTVTVAGKAVNTVSGVCALAKELGGTAVLRLVEAEKSNSADKNVTPIKNNGLIDSYYAINDGQNHYLYRVNPALSANEVNDAGWDVLTMPILSEAKTLTVTDAEMTDTNLVNIKFDAAKVGNSGGVAYVRLVDAQGNVLTSTTEGTPLEWKATMGYVTWPNTPMTLKINNSIIVDGHAVSTVEGVLALKETYAGSRAVFYLIEDAAVNAAKNVTPVKGNGYIDSYFANNDGSNKYIPRDNPALTANGVNASGWDTLTVEILEEAPTLILQGVTANAGGLTIAFSAEKVGNAGAYATLSIKGTDLSWELNISSPNWPNTPMKATPKGITMAEILDMVSEGGAHAGKDLVFTLREGTKSDSAKNVTATKNNGLIDSYYAINEGSNKYIYRVNPSLTADSVDKDGWDCVTRTVVISSTGTMKITDVKVISDTRLLITFSEPIKMLGNAWAGLRVVDENYNLMYYNEGQSPLQWYGRSSKQGYPFEWANEEHTQIYWTYRAVNTMNLTDIGQVLRAEGQLGEVMKDNWKIVFCFEEKKTDTFAVTAANGLIDSVVSATDGKPIKPTVVKAGWNDGVYMDVSGEAPTEKLEVTDVKVISDSRIVVTFSAPVEMLSSPYGAIRLVNDTNALQYRINEDETKTPIQWGGAFLDYYNEEHTQLVWQIYGNQRNFGDLNNIPDILAFKGLPEEWKAFTFKFCIEEKGSDALSADNHINNIVLADDERVHLLGNKPNMNGFDGHYADVAYTITEKNLTANAYVLNDRQVVLAFSAPVEISGDPWFGIRLVRDGKLAWSGKENDSTALQWKGKWEWMDKSHTRILWTMNGSSTYGIYNVYDILNYGGGLAPFKETTTVNWCIEEKKTDEFKDLISYSQRIENIVTKDGTRHLVGSYCNGYDGVFIPLTANGMGTDLLTVAAVKAIDDMTLEVKFSESVKIAEGDGAPNMAIRYLTESGDSHTLVTGHTAAFNGTWEWKDDTHDTILWTLTPSASKGAMTLTDIFTYAGNLVYSKGARIAFCVSMTEKNATSTYSLRVDGITDISGKRALYAPRLEEICISQTDIEIGYELPAPTVEPEVQEGQTVTDYTLAYMLAGALALVGAGVGLILALKRKEENR